MPHLHMLVIIASLFDGHHHHEQAVLVGIAYDRT